MKSNKYFLLFLTIIYSIIQRVLAQVYYNFHDQGNNLKEISPLLISENISNQTHSIKVESDHLKNFIGATYQAIFEFSTSSPKNISFIIQDQSQRILHLILSQSIQSFTIQQIVEQPYLIYTIYSYGKDESVWNLFKIKGLRLFININNYQLKQNNSYQNINSSFLRLLQKCGEQQFFHPIYQRCENCHPNCKGCTEYKKCKDCQKKAQLQRYDQLADGFCDNCPSGQRYDIQNQCKGCSDTCNCDNSNKQQCISCKDKSKNQLNVEKNTCEPCQQDQGYYIDGQFCKRCNIICKTCKGPSDSDCLECIDGAKKYEDGSCRYNNQNPNDCISPYKQDKSSNCVCNQDGYYLKDKNCVECQADLKCQKCSIETQCTQCYTNKPEKYLQDGKKCSDCKQNGYFIDQSQSICENCIKNCSICNNKSECQKCNSGFYFLEDNKSCSQCEQDGYYIDKSNQFCNKCPQEKMCQKCNNNLKCTECQSGLYLFNSDNCIPCDEGYFKSGKNCFKCADNCEKCSSEFQCIQCSQGYFLKGNVCQQCSPQMKCLTCINEISCESCELGKFIQKDGKCDKCEQGYYIENKYCRQCKIGCSSCTSYFKCNQCMPQFYKLKTE
ncbi:zinc finger lsd1 subclass family protein (macronuclear) [Tetrahymena thermophila SB210]|uniref:Zinc finger lsd1 subclass family protein n=1 Tax=Tetrahymena thermophila (strain SB210) TaxID=312017 RepID=Q23F43_TETTS|nr:zinc finger lsd1 subclass family protein [Tetrahymena thermophila SB210]EAR95062.2 zinc finger lsd1 subclass family protein [Tetrahymena thermophila SB210]|eukprot:XP_001015307.2 zinc finger lsd1 subclass family protein [Tetrahymena thermophila SB210]